MSPPATLTNSTACDAANPPAASRPLLAGLRIVGVIVLSVAVVSSAAAKQPDDKQAASKAPPAKKPATTAPAKNSSAKKPSAAKPEQPWTPGGKYRAHDMNRPRPPVVVPPQFTAGSASPSPPSDAIVLFDGKSLDAWLTEGRDPKTKRPLTMPAAWPIRDGAMEVPPRSAGNRGSIVTREEFGSCQLHIEWATPEKVTGSGQGRGNSGIMLHGLCEVQVLDSHENDTYPDGQAAAIYSKYPPLVNASRRPGEWQTYDIIVELARLLPPKSVEPSTFVVQGEVVKKLAQSEKPKLVPARITVLHNGIVVQHAEELPSTVQKFKLALQDHNNPVRYRNIWVRPLGERK